MTFTHSVASNNFGCAKWIVSANVYEGTHTTIGAALTSASSGDTIFIRPGTYTENLTLKAGVNLTAYGSDFSLNGTGKVIISGNATMSTAGSVTISGIQLQTNSAALLTVSGSVASIVNLNNCYLNCTNNTGISYSSSSGSSAININNCYGDLGTTGIGIWLSSSAGTISCQYSKFTNSGASTTATTHSAGNISVEYCQFKSPISSTSTGGIALFHWNFVDTSGQNTTSLTVNGSGTSVASKSEFSSGSASAISIGTGATLTGIQLNTSSTNTNAITGAGTYNFSLPSSSTGSSLAMNVTSQVDGQGSTFTPVLSFGGGSTGITYTTQYGKYVRIGSLVFFAIQLILSSKGSSTGGAAIGGLPFTSANTTGEPCLAILSSRIATSASTQQFAQVNVNATSLNLYYCNIATTNNISQIPDTSFDNTSNIAVSGFYFTT